MFTLSHFSSRNAGNPLTKAFQCAIFVETTTKKNNKIMMKEMIRKVMEWCKLWNGETATAKQGDPSSDKRENVLFMKGEYGYLPLLPGPERSNLPLKAITFADFRM